MLLPWPALCTCSLFVSLTYITYHPVQPASTKTIGCLRFGNMCTMRAHLHTTKHSAVGQCSWEASYLMQYRSGSVTRVLHRLCCHPGFDRLIDPKLKWQACQNTSVQIPHTILLLVLHLAGFHQSSFWDPRHGCKSMHASTITITCMHLISYERSSCGHTTVFSCVS